MFLRTLAECMSIHSAATWLLDNQPWDFFAVYYDAIDHFCHGFMRYHPPRQSWIGERDFELYHNVVSMAYQFHDQMLGTLLEKAGEDVTVILMSDHGFHPDHLRPASIPDIPAGPAIEHRDFGILAISGPGIKKDELLHGPSRAGHRADNSDALRIAGRRRHGRQGAFAGLRRRRRRSRSFRAGKRFRARMDAIRRIRGWIRWRRTKRWSR